MSVEGFSPKECKIIYSSHDRCKFIIHADHNCGYGCVYLKKDLIWDVRPYPFTPELNPEYYSNSVREAIGRIRKILPRAKIVKPIS